MGVRVKALDKAGYPPCAEQALEQLMTDYGDAVLHTAFFYLRDRYLAEDISQEVFIRAFRGWGSFRGNSSVKTWLMRITINLCHNQRAAKVNRESPVDLQVAATAYAGDLEQEVLKRISQTQIVRHMLELPRRQQEVLFLYYYLGFNTREIAEAKEAAESTVRSQLSRARDALKQRLEKEEL